MDLEITPDQRDLRAVARQFLDDRAPLTLARAYLDGEPAAAPLHEQLGELGWYAVGLDPTDGFGTPGLALLAEQAGAHTAPTALVDTAVAARVAALMDGDLAREIAAGDAPASLAVVEAGADWSLTGLTTTLRADTLTGEKAGVQHGGTVHALLVVAEADGEPAAALIAAGAPGVDRSAPSGLDPAAATVVVTLDEARPAATLTGEAAHTALTAAFAVGAVANAAEGLGAASGALDLAIEYAKERQQFGRPIGSFQALKHVIADAHVDREAAWSSVLYAAAALDERLPGAGEAASIAAAYGARASRRVVEAALQVLGGIAFTWEHDVHLLQRRVLACERRFGDALYHEARLGDLLASRTTAPVPA
jgi:acyl-CoA dehydrogenase